MAAAAISINFFIIINILGLYFIRVVKTHGKGRDFLSESKRSKPKLTFPLRLSSIIRNTARGVLALARYTSEFLTRIVTTQVKDVKGLYTEVSNVRHIAFSTKSDLSNYVSSSADFR